MNMEGGFLAEFEHGFRLRVGLFFVLQALATCGATFVILNFIDLSNILSCLIIFLISILIGIPLTLILSQILLKPTRYLAQAIFHIAPDEQLVSSPNLDELNLGKKLVNNLVRIIHNMTINRPLPQALEQINNSAKSTSETIIDQIPVGIIGLDSSARIAYLNQTASDGFHISDGVGKSISQLLNIKFPSDSLESWIQTNKQQSITTHKIWRKIDITTQDQQKRSYYDVAGIFRQNHSSGIETLLAFFNHDDLFQIEEEALSIISLSVHEIRTPLTIVRGYIDALREELDGKLTAQDKEYFERLRISCQNLTTYMHNILNVVKADKGQLTLNLQETDWKIALSAIIINLNARAIAHNKVLELYVQDNLPSIAVDQSSIGEVLTNIVENAIKYSPPASKTIKIQTMIDSSGYILTTIQDQGVGIPESVVPNLFTKFQRNHRNAKSISGTGLGLYLSKAIITAHHGNIWVKSKEGQGTIVGFTLLPYTELVKQQKDIDNVPSMVSHGWIKNHSMQRR